MATFKSLEEAREHFKKDRFAAFAGVEIDEMTDNTAVCSMTLSDAHKNAYGGVMGGAIFTLADLAFAVVANQRQPIAIQKAGQRTSVVSGCATVALGPIIQFEDRRND